jgi:hypothetical protein
MLALPEREEERRHFDRLLMARAIAGCAFVEPTRGSTIGINQSRLPALQRPGIP